MRKRQPHRLRIDLGRQMLVLYENDHPVRQWPVSTAEKGAGQQEGSNQTPLGQHVIRARIGGDQPSGMAFKGRRPTGDIWSPSLHEACPGRDWILSRILWLSGTETGYNRLGQVDSMRRFIYIHGTPDCEPMGEPRSHGCVRMRNEDVIELFNLVDTGTPVWIHL